MPESMDTVWTLLMTAENIPDLKLDLDSPPHPARCDRAQGSVDARPSRGADPEDIPYHARQDSRPFTYGSVPAGETMLRAQAGLSSPSLVRKASFKSDPPVNGTVSPPPREIRRSTSNHSVPSPDFHEGSIVSGSISQHNTNNLTWLQRQQQKLRERREIQLRSERNPHESRLLSELRTVQTNSYRSFRPSPSQRVDGYTSDTTLFADEDDGDFSIPLHINTTANNHKNTNGSSAPVSPLLPHRTSSRRNYSTSSSAQHQFNMISNSNTLGRQKSESSFDRERPFVAVKRSHEQNRKYSENSSPDTYSELSQSTNQDSGLLSMVEGERPTTERLNNGINNGVGNSDALSSLIASLAATSSSPSNGSDATNSTSSAWSPTHNQLRDESYSSWRTTSLSEETGGSPPHSSSPRPQTPAFPVHPRTPYVNNSSNQFDSPAAGLPPKSPTAQRKEWSPVTETLVREHREHSTSTLRGYESDSQYSPKSPMFTGTLNGSTNGGQSSPSVYYGQSRRSSIHSNSEPPQDVSPAHVKFVRDTSRFWYKPAISREEAIAMLRDKQPGTFVVRDSNSFPGAFGLALKVATPPPTTPVKNSSADPSTELVRHFLIEPTSRGVKLKGCANEPVFSSLSALVYQHSLMPLALPCRLTLPESDPSRPLDGTNTISTAQLLLAQGAACNVLYLLTVDTESLTGPQAIVRAVTELFSKSTLPTAAVVHFKVSGQGITLTDNKRQLFFRRHYPVSTISYCGLDPDDHRWTQRNENGIPISSNRCFGFIARKPASKTDNQCHIFAELEPEQPATAIVNFVSKVMMNSGISKSNIV
uniref:SH2 domain-containing protein n=1 Tax=Clastoptera arizonana TaxID=38151 RepID=A0A1B6CBI1_9HEMI